MTRLHAHFDGRVLIPDEPVDLPQGCTLEVHVQKIPSTGSGQVIWAALKRGPLVTDEDSADLEAAIRSGKLALAKPPIFDED